MSLGLGTVVKELAQAADLIELIPKLWIKNAKINLLVHLNAGSQSLLGLLQGKERKDAMILFAQSCLVWESAGSTARQVEPVSKVL